MQDPGPSPQVEFRVSAANVGRDPVWIPVDAERSFGDVQTHTTHTKQGDTTVYEVSILDRRTGKQVDIVKTNEPMQLIHYRDPTGREVQVLQRIDPSHAPEIVQAQEATAVTRNVYTDVERKQETTTEVKTTLQPEPDVSEPAPKHNTPSHHAAPMQQPHHHAPAKQAAPTHAPNQPQGALPHTLHHVSAHSSAVHHIAVRQTPHLEAAHHATTQQAPPQKHSVASQTHKAEIAHTQSESHAHASPSQMHPNQNHFAGKTHQMPISPFAIAGQMIADMAHNMQIQAAKLYAHAQIHAAQNGICRGAKAVSSAAGPYAANKLTCE